MTDNLHLERTRFAEIRRRILELHPEIDEQTLGDTLEGATDLSEALAAVIRSALDDECLARALKSRLDDMRARLSRIEARASAKRLAAVETMEQTQLRKLTEPDFTASVRFAPPSTVITNEAELPPRFLTPQPPKPDRRAILQALISGSVVPGATLAEARLSLSVRSK